MRATTPPGYRPPQPPPPIDAHDWASYNQPIDDEWSLLVKDAAYVKREQKAFDERQMQEFKAAGWSFDPTLNGFKIAKRFRDSILAKNYDPTKFKWYAEFFRWYYKDERRCTITCEVRKQKDVYLVRVCRTKEAQDSYSSDIQNTKTFECEFPDQHGWECFLKDHKIT